MKAKITHLVCALACTLAASAQFKSTKGPVDGGVFDALYAFGDTAFFELNNMPWRTLDGGTTWEPCMGEIPTVPNPDAFTERDGVMYMATNSLNRLYKSNDYGDTWEVYYNGLPRTFGMPSMVPRLMITSGDRMFLGGANSGLWRNDHPDSAWVKIEDIPGGYVFSLDRIGQDSIMVTQGSAWGGLSYFSSDNGDTWTQLAAEPNTTPYISASGYVYYKGRLIALSDAGGSNSTFYSDDFGTTWTKSTDGPAVGRKIVKTQDKVYASNFRGVYESEDGITWTLRPESSPASNQMTLWKNNSELLVGTSGYGLFTHELPTLARSQEQIAAANPRALYQSGSALICVTDGGFYALENGNWNKRSVIDFLGSFSVGGDPLVHDVVEYDGITYLAGKSGLYTSNNGGESFDTVFTFYGKYGAMYRKGSNFEIMVLGERPNQFDPRYINGRVYYKDANGDFVEASYSNGDRMSIRPSHFLEHNGKLFLTGASKDVYVSSDNGQTWEQKQIEQTVSHMLELEGKLMFYYYQYPSGKIAYTEDAFETTVDYDISELPIANPSLKWYYFSGIHKIDGKLSLYIHDPALDDDKNGLYTLSGFQGNFSRVDESILPADPRFLVGSLNKLYAGIINWSVWSNDEQATNIQEFANQSQQAAWVYPNPSSGLFKFVQGATDYQVLDLSGKVVSGGYASSVDLSGEQAGVYFVITPAGTQKIIKK